MLGPLLRLCEQKSVDIDVYLKEIGLSAELLRSEHVPIGKVPHFWKLYENLEEASHRDDLGFILGEKLDIKDMGILGTQVRNASTFHEAVQISSYFLPKLCHGIQLDLVQEGEYAHLVYTREHESICKAADQITVLYTLRLLSRAAGGHVPISIDFQSEEPNDLGIASQIDCPLRFDQETTKVTIPRIALADAVAVPKVDTEQSSCCDKELPSPNSMADMLYAVLETLLKGGGLLSSSEACEMLDMSRATLARKLEADRTNYQSIVDRLRFTMGREMLRDPSLSVKEVSYRLNYSNPSAFTRSFLAQSGMPPSVYREMLLKRGAEVKN